MDTADILKEYGLSEKESIVYLQLLPLGSTNLQEIAKRVDLPRTTIYNTLNYLASRGLVSSIKNNAVTFYEAADPNKLVDALNEKKRLVESIVPELESLRAMEKESSSVELFRGSKGLFTILSDVFKQKQQTYYFGSYSLSKAILEHQPEHFRTIRLDKKIPAKIVIESYDEEVFHTSKYQELTQMRFNDSLKEFPCMIFIYGKKVAMYTLKKDLVGVIISNQQVAQAMKFVFDMYWSAAKKTIRVV